ncbi:MAG: carbamate kinase [Bacillota bacterium]
MNPKTIVIALGGNAVLQPGQKGTAEEQMENVRKTAVSTVRMIQAGHRVVITHGNGPQVGNILIQNEEAKERVPPMPLDVCGAKSQGKIGYMVQQALANEISSKGLDMPVATLVTQVLVDAEDPAFSNPTKPIGPFYTQDRAEALMKSGMMLKEDAGRGWRRVVPSPDPKAICEVGIIKRLVDSGVVLIACGGGGIPVVRENGTLRGVEAVIDKDLAGERLAHAVGAQVFLVLTDVERVSINYRTPQEKPLSTLNVEEAGRYLKEGHFGSGSMEPKVRAAMRFVANGGERAIITSLFNAEEALQGLTGTCVTR